MSEPLNPIHDIQNTLAALDPSALVVGFATVVEWLEEDGSHNLTVLHTDMSPWQLFGMMTFAREHHCGGFPSPEEIAAMLEDDDEDE